MLKQPDMPNGGESWLVSSSQIVEWGGNLGRADTAEIALSTDTGRTKLSGLNTAHRPPLSCEMATVGDDERGATPSIGFVPDCRTS